MKLEEKIRDRKIVYLFRRKPEIAFELALLYFILAKRKDAKRRIAEACSKAIYWLRKAGIAIPEYLEQLTCFGQIEEIEKILVFNQAKIDACTA
jgi:hypothetical protein